MKPRVLIADDSRTFRKILQDIVEKAGWEVQACCEDGAQALAEFQRRAPDLVLLDVTMPNMSGKQCLEEILRKQPSARVIMISALTDPALQAECLKIGAQGFISKALATSADGLRQELSAHLKLAG